MSDIISFKEFAKLDIRIGKVVSAEKIKRSKKLILLKVDIGGEERQLVAGLAPYYSPDELVGKEIVVLVNLEPKIFMGYRSEGMLLAADINGKPVLLVPEKEVPPGSRVR